MDASNKKAYTVAVMIQLMYTGMFVISKAAFDKGVNTYVFIFYRLAAATALLLPLALVLERSRRINNIAPAMSSRLLLKLFLYALLGMEVINLRSCSGLCKVAGIALCLAGVVVIALYTGPSISPLHHHRPVFAARGSSLAQRHAVTNTAGSWIKGTFLMLLACATLSLWIVLQVPLLKEYPNKLTATTMQCVFGTIQCFFVAAVVERDLSRWKLGLDIGLLAILYSGFVGTGAVMYLQSWCTEMKGPVFVAMWSPLALVFTIFCSSFFLGEAVHLGSVLGGAVMVGGLYSVLWGKSKESRPRPAAEQEAAAAAANNASGA